jgi:hypothetical protein
MKRVQVWLNKDQMKKLEKAASKLNKSPYGCAKMLILQGLERLEKL